MSLWIVDGGIGLTLPVVARVDDWQEGDHIDVTGADENGEWLPDPVRYVKERGTCKRVFYKLTGVYVCSECGYGLSKKLDKYCFLRYCPACGKRIEVDECANT